MPRLLLVVEDAFTGRGPGVLVMPRVTADVADAAGFAARLALPGGASRDVRAKLDVAHMKGGLPPYALVRLLDVTLDDVPRGSELFIADAEGT